MSKYRRIKYEGRSQIYALSKRGSSQESIAEVLGVSQSAVSREIDRNRGERGYRFKQAEAKAQARQAIRSKPRKLTVPTRSKIEAKLRQMRWSPEQISGWLSEQGIKLSHERIYQMIWDDKRHLVGVVQSRCMVGRSEPFGVSAKPDPSGLGGLQGCPSSRSNHLPLMFGDGREDVER